MNFRLALVSPPKSSNLVGYQGKSHRRSMLPRGKTTSGTPLAFDHRRIGCGLGESVGSLCQNPILGKSGSSEKRKCHRRSLLDRSKTGKILPAQCLFCVFTRNIVPKLHIHALSDFDCHHTLEFRCTHIRQPFLPTIQGILAICFR